VAQYIDVDEYISEFPDSCIEWEGKFWQNGYGKHRVKVDGRWTSRGVHRTTYINFHGPIPEGLIVRHTCDNRACYNIKHLVLGTHRDNRHDAVERGRAYLGFAEPTHPMYAGASA
jgi:hypothetical protein